MVYREHARCLDSIVAKIHITPLFAHAPYRAQRTRAARARWRAPSGNANDALDTIS